MFEKKQVYSIALIQKPQISKYAPFLHFQEAK
jgi:hypothetical protein